MSFSHGHFSLLNILFHLPNNRTLLSNSTIHWTHVLLSLVSSLSKIKYAITLAKVYWTGLKHLQTSVHIVWHVSYMGGVLVAAINSSFSRMSSLCFGYSSNLSAKPKARQSAQLTQSHSWAWERKQRKK